MKTILATLSVICSLICLASATPALANSVSECTFDAMKALTIEGLKTTVIDSLNEATPSPIEVKPEDILIEYKGLLPFDDSYGTDPQIEHAFAVSFKSARGTPLMAISANYDHMCMGDINKKIFLGELCYDRPSFSVVSIENPKTSIRYDNEGNEVARFCEVYHDPNIAGNKTLLFINSRTEVTIHGVQISSSIATAEIK